ncbi:ABC-F family ATP-binding cassette domain-containing protein [Parvibaculum sp.]|uniref:ABC-F family ATP-binding cassette domain-containing protein n=1 Tax=Parvibaculum sp. TaxID=2024848 RepID=UPI00272EFB11|nr:ATP-binding cassette domain-containing protein [Parvibaculum sp.]MDP1627489.1 ATP-binding cassette domain-containing protein [Parvibaculum sp.]MDP2148668.1 ATP-binding cassette domain-containing protein [Parvibaculum sp.]MDP3326694.1 ATP-binding cassette domain-containing protein [Parvibaculum sp.]
MAAPLLALRDIRVVFADQVLIAGASFALAPGDRLCLVGRNGSGKSTLLRIAAGLVDPDGGEIFRQPGTRIAYLEQMPDFGGARTVIDYATAGGAEAHKAAAALDELKLSPSAGPATLSGGEGRKAALARVLAEEPDILLLDEPTNHLDLPSIEWLEERLSQFRGAFVLISHDRAFLRRLAAGCLWLDRGAIRRLDKGFAEFDAWSEQIVAEEEVTARKLERLIEQETQWSREGISARRTRNQGRLRRLHSLRAERAGQIGQAGRIDLVAESGQASGSLVVEAKNITKIWPQPDGSERVAVRDFSTRIMRGDKVGLIGPNGAGKTTLLRILTGTLAPDSGSVRLGTNLTPVYVDQSRSSLDPEATLWQTLCEGGGDQVLVRGQPRHVVSYLKDFLFRESQARQPVKALSGGEQCRLLLARALAKPSNLLILDEPTNDLDMDTLDLLQEVLADYDGTVLLVSHDRDFLDRVVTSVVALDGEGTAVEYPGGYSDYLRQRKQAAAATRSAASPAPKTERARTPTKLSYKDTRALEELQARMPELARDIAAIEKKLADPDLYARDPDLFHKTMTRHDALKAELAEAEERWLELEMKREELSGG